VGKNHIQHGLLKYAYFFPEWNGMQQAKREKKK
jgi:hypothetical protein